MFISGVNESDVIEIVRQFKNKRSTDINNIDMVIVKDGIYSIVFFCIVTD